LPVAAVAQGDDPSLAHREHAVGAVIPTSAEMGVNPWRPHADPVHDIDIRRQSDTAIPHVPSSFGEEFSSDSSGALRAAAARPSSSAEPRTAGASASQRNTCRLHGLTGQWTHFSRACRRMGEQER
jgi:hypothetical protein